MHSVPSHSASKPHDSDYSRNRARSIRFLILLAAILALAFFLSLRAGSYNTPAAELIRGIFGRASDAKINLVIRNNRLPRICTAMVAGAGLGLAGCILQAVLRNPLASASTLGVSQGATFGAAVAIIGLGLSQAGSWAIPLCSFLGSLLVAAVILGLSQFKQISSEGIVLAGVAISSMLTGATTLLQYFADEVALSSLVFWTFGDLGSTDWQSLRGMALAVLLLIGYCYLHRWDYNALLSGEETALSLGIHVRRLTLTNVVLTCFVCSVIVSHVGLINHRSRCAAHRAHGRRQQLYLSHPRLRARRRGAAAAERPGRARDHHAGHSADRRADGVSRRPAVSVPAVQGDGSDMICVDHLCYHYKGGRPILRDVSFELETGHFLAVLGNNGVGKSTLLKCMNRILTADSGHCRIDGEDLLTLSHREIAKRVAFVAQHVPDTQMTVHDMVMLGRRPYMTWGVTEHDHHVVHEAMRYLNL